MKIPQRMSAVRSRLTAVELSGSESGDARLSQRGKDEIALSICERTPDGESALVAPGIGSPLGLHVSRPDQDAAVVVASGDIDDATITRFEEIVLARLRAALRVVVLDLSRVHFLGVAGLKALRTAQLLAQQRNVRLYLVATDHEVLRALHTAELGEVLPVHATVPAALGELDVQGESAG